MPPRDIGLALSGGGFRAVAFHLGCLRALNDHNLLDRVQVVSGVSGGALAGAMWAYKAGSFEEYDGAINDLLRGGLEHSIFRGLLRPDRVVGGLAGWAAAAAWAGGSVVLRGRPQRGQARALRPATRSIVFRDTLRRKVFGDVRLGETVQPVTTVLSALDLVSGNAVRFGSAVSGCSAYGTMQGEWDVATAVAASAAYPLTFPALEVRTRFRRGDGQETQQALLLTDGGVYDNLGISVFAPGRETAYSQHVYDVRYVIACDAGQGRRPATEAHLWPGRMRRVFEVAHRRGQDAARGALHSWRASGALDGFVHAYLGMQDQRLPIPVADLVPREQCWDYPTRLARMSARDIQLLADRGEQLVRVLLQAYCPKLVSATA